MCNIVSKWGKKKEGIKKKTGTVAVRFLIDSNKKNKIVINESYHRRGLC